MSFEALWVEKFRPKALNEYAFQCEENKEIFTSYVQKGEFPHLLLAGTHGVGKSTIVRVLLNECHIDPCDTLFVNGSLKTGIDEVRDRIDNFCSSYATNSKFRVVVIEECDRLSPHAQDALKDVIEAHAETCRFLMTCNTPSRVAGPMVSRCQRFHFQEFDMASMVDYVLRIIDAEGVQIDDMAVLAAHIEAHAPDLRSVIQSVQQSSTTGVLKAPLAGAKSSVMSEWEGVWKSSPTKDRLLPLLTAVDESNYEDYYRVMYQNVENLGDRTDAAIVAIADAMYRSAFSADKQLTMHACLIEVFQ